MGLLRHPIGRGGTRPQTRRICNDMDESEVGGPMRCCRNCEEFGHETNASPKGDDGAGSSNSSVCTGGRGRGRARMTIDQNAEAL